MAFSVCLVAAGLVLVALGFGSAGAGFGSAGVFVSAFGFCYVATAAAGFKAVRMLVCSRPAFLRNSETRRTASSLPVWKN